MSSMIRFGKSYLNQQTASPIPQNQVPHFPIQTQFKRRIDPLVAIQTQPVNRPLGRFSRARYSRLTRNRIVIRKKIEHLDGNFGERIEGSAKTSKQLNLVLKSVNSAKPS